MGIPCGRARYLLALGTVLAGALLAVQPCLFALDPTLDVSQYAHTAWKVREGFSKGSITSIAQTPDGYLWLGTEFGLLRFDGVRNVAWQPASGQHLPSIYIRSLLAARDGTLWLGTAEGLASLRDGKLNLYPVLAGQAVDALLEDRQGTVWIGIQTVPAAKLCAIQNGSIYCYGEDGKFGQHIDSLYQDRGGNLWVGALTGLWRWTPGPPKLYSVPAAENGIRGLIEGDNNTLFMTTSAGIGQLLDGRYAKYPIPNDELQFTPRELLLDRDGGLWIGTANLGLIHVHHGRTDVFTQSNGLSGDFIEKLFEDREGNIWVATIDGLDRFRDFAVPTISVKQGLSNPIVESVLVAHDGTVWAGTVDGLDRLHDGQITVYRHRNERNEVTGKLERKVSEVFDQGLPDDKIESLFQDREGRLWVSTRRGVAYFQDDRFTTATGELGGVHSFAEDNTGNLWISAGQGLFRLFQGAVVERIPWAALGRSDGVRSLIADPAHGGIWLGFRDGGVAYFKDGQLGASYAVGDGLGPSHVRDLQFGTDGALWIATERGLSRLKDGHVATLTSKNGLPCDSVHWALEDEDQSFWLYMACDLVRIAGSEWKRWVAAEDPTQKIQTAVFDSSDGIRSHATTTGYSPSVAKSSDGRIWFLPWDGVSVINPHQLSFNKLPPPVHIEQITAEHKAYEATSDRYGNVRLPPHVRDLAIDYTALSLVAPEKVLFRYKLDGWDRDWQVAGTRRQAFYSNLPPASYRFRVTASNNSGVWNEAGASTAFSVSPAYYQTGWFRLSCVAAFLGLLYALYQVRLHQLTRLLHIRFEERLAERTRIAQELHDTLLQGVLSASMQLHVAVDQLPESPARATVERVLHLIGNVIEEGRNAVRGLRSSIDNPHDLSTSFSQIPEQLGEQDGIDFCVIVEGQLMPLRSVIRDNVYNIGREALVNAFRHSRASTIEVQLVYSADQLRIVVRDNGCGIEPEMVRSGREGHWGLKGMRERAERIGAKFKVMSRHGAGTEVELSIPGSIAFEVHSHARPKWFSGAARSRKHL